MTCCNVQMSSWQSTSSILPMNAKLLMLRCAMLAFPVHQVDPDLLCAVTFPGNLLKNFRCLVTSVKTLGEAQSSAGTRPITTMFVLGAIPHPLQRPLPTSRVKPKQWTSLKCYVCRRDSARELHPFVSSTKSMGLAETDDDDDEAAVAGAPNPEALRVFTERLKVLPALPW